MTESFTIKASRIKIYQEKPRGRGGRMGGAGGGGDGDGG